MSADEKQEPCLPPRIITNLLGNGSFASTLLEYHTADPHDTSEAILSAPTLGGAFVCPTVRESVAWHRRDLVDMVPLEPQQLFWRVAALVDVPERRAGVRVVQFDVGEGPEAPAGNCRRP